MSRTQRLLDLLQLLRRHRRPVSGMALARELGVSLRTLYRDIATLQAQGADISGEAGVGYVLKPGFLLPPLMLTENEIEALVLGARWVQRRADPALASAAQDALAKIAAVLPEDIRAQMDATPLLIGPGEAQGESHLAVLRAAIRGQIKLAIQYGDAEGAITRRIIWPFGIGFFQEARVVMAWCEMRQDFRHFRLDRMAQVTRTELRYPERRQILLARWKKTQRIHGE